FDLFSPAVSWRDVERLTDLSGLPVVVKGVLTAEDARLACEHGAAAIAVSNHGGRQLDGVPGTLDALPEVVEAVEGRVEVVVDGAPVRLAAEKPRALLALLLLNRNRVVPTERLVDELWGEEAPARATKALQVYISQLRKALGPERLVTRPPGYELRVDEEEL